MKTVYWIDNLSVPLIFIATILLVFGAINAGRYIGSRNQTSSGGGESIGSVVGATLGLLAFLLAFTFNMAANRFDNRKELMLKELNAIDTAFRRAGLLPSSMASEARNLLVEYVNLRVKIAQDPSFILEAVRRSEEIQDQLWQVMETVSGNQPLDIRYSLYIQSVNELMNLLEERVVVALHFRIPGAIWLGLYILAILAMIAVGYQFGQSNRRQLLVSITLAVAFSSVIALISDLDRATSGIIKLNQQPLFEYQQKIESANSQIHQ